MNVLIALLLVAFVVLGAYGVFTDPLADVDWSGSHTLKDEDGKT